MNATAEGEFRIEHEDDIVKARMLVRDAANEMGFSLTDVTRIVTAASELSRNIYVHATRGVMKWRPLSNGTRLGLELVFADEGPGIADVSRALIPGNSTGKGLGLGLSGSKRLMNEMTIESEVGKGTRITVVKWLSR